MHSWHLHLTAFSIQPNCCCFLILLHHSINILCLLLCKMEKRQITPQCCTLGCMCPVPHPISKLSPKHSYIQCFRLNLKNHNKTFFITRSLWSKKGSDDYTILYLSLPEYAIYIFGHGALIF